METEHTQQNVETEVETFELEGEESLEEIANDGLDPEEQEQQQEAPRRRLLLPSEQGLPEGAWREQKAGLQKINILRCKLRKYSVKYPQVAEELGLEAFNLSILSEDDLEFLIDQFKMNLALERSERLSGQMLFAGINLAEEFAKRFDPNVEGLSQMLACDPEFISLQDQFSIEHSSGRIIPVEMMLAYKILSTYMVMTKIKKMRAQAEVDLAEKLRLEQGDPEFTENDAE